jgi:hypothetical protein
MPAADSGRITIHYGFALLAVFSLLGTIVPALALFSTVNDPETKGYGAGMGVVWLIWGGMWDPHLDGVRHPPHIEEPAMSKRSPAAIRLAFGAPVDD